MPNRTPAPPAEPPAATRPDNHTSAAHAPQEPAEPFLVSHKRAAALCGMSQASWFRKLSAGLIGPRPVHIGPGCIRWCVEELREWVAQGCPDRKGWAALRAAKRARH